MKMDEANNNPEVTAAMEAKGFKLWHDGEGWCYARVGVPPESDEVEWVIATEGELPTSLDQKVTLYRAYRDERGVTMPLRDIPPADGISYNKETKEWELWIDGIPIEFSPDRADLEVILEAGELRRCDEERKRQAWNDAVRMLPADLQTQLVN
jgi:hypothetical protein